VNDEVVYMLPLKLLVVEDHIPSLELMTEEGVSLSGSVER
jgi:hypothetical protein